MELTTLIAMAAQRMLADDPSLIGVRLSPVTLQPDDAKSLIKELRARLGAATYIALSVPGAAPLSSDRVFVSADATAAERATQWRNEVQVPAGEHLVYVSVQTHGKAGGLKDTLTPIGERDLREEFLRWCGTKDSGFPTGFDAALREANILDGASAAALCEYAKAVSSDRRREGWEASGHHLPLLGLGRDVSLKGPDAAARLAENSKIVTKAATGERAGSSPVAAKIRKAFERAPEDIPKSLASIDISDALDEAVRRRQKGGAKRRDRNESKPASKQRPKARKKRPEQSEAEQLIEAAQSARPDRREDALKRKAESLGEPLAPSDEPSSSDDLDEAEPPVWDKVHQGAERRALEEVLPAGLARMIQALMEGGGFGLSWAARNSASALLREMPATPDVSPVGGPPGPDSEHGELFARFSVARTALVEALRAGGRGSAGIAQLIARPLVTLARTDVRERARALLGVAEELMTLASQGTDGSLRATISQMETVRSVAKTGDCVLVLGPLHPLMLAQALGRVNAILADGKLEEESKSLVARSLSVAPAAPDTWPVRSDLNLHLSRAQAGLVTYQSAAIELEPDDVADAAAAVLGTYVDLSPHARLGLRVAVVGQTAGPVVEGAAELLTSRVDLRSVTVLCGGEGIPELSEEAQEQMRIGRLNIDSLAAVGITLDTRAHVVIRLVPSVSDPSNTEQAVPSHHTHASGRGLLPTEFEVIGTGLRVRTRIDAKEQPALAAFEALHALQSGRAPQSAFVRVEFAASLRTMLANRSGVAKSAWDVVMAPKVATSPPPGHFLLSHERFSDRLEVAIVGEAIAPASRALRSGFQLLGIQELTPTMVRDLATRLAGATNRGVVSPRRSGEHLIAASIVAVALREALGSGGFVAPLSGASASTLLGDSQVAADEAMSLGFAARGDTLEMVIGYAALKNAAELRVVRGKLIGALADRCERLLKWLNLALSPQNDVASIAAREALNWLLFPALAAGDADTTAIQALLRALHPGAQLVTRVICYVPQDENARPATAKLGSASVSVQPLNVTTFEELVLSGGFTSAA